MKTETPAASGPRTRTPIPGAGLEFRGARARAGAATVRILLLSLVAALGALAVMTIAIGRRNTLEMTNRAARPHVVLVGASIGQAWQLAGWPERVASQAFTAESVAAWQFDKSEVLDELLIRPTRKFHLTRSYLKSLLRPPPARADLIILKECSSYFPGDTRAYVARVDAWVRQVRAAHALPVLATVVPVTRARSARDPGKQESLLEYNRQLRAYAQAEGIALLDLEAALRDAGEGSFLRDDLTSGDGSHLNARAYSLLDRELHTALDRLAPVVAQRP